MPAVVSTLLVLVMYRLRWFDAASCVLAVGLALLASLLGGWPWVLPALAFAVVSKTLATVRFAGEPDPYPSRLEQTVICGLVPTLPVLGHALDGSPVWYWAYAGAVSVTSSDTLASQSGRIVGRLMHCPPVSLRDGQQVAAGTSGSVSVPGVLGAVFGAALVAVIAAAAGQSPDRGRLLLVAACAGIFGAGVDSLLGAWAQCRYRCERCRKLTEDRAHCGAPCHAVSGVPGLTNERVNLVAIVAGAALAGWLR